MLQLEELLLLCGLDNDSHYKWYLVFKLLQQNRNRETNYYHGLNLRLNVKEKLNASRLNADDLPLGSEIEALLFL